MKTTTLQRRTESLVCQVTWGGGNVQAGHGLHVLVSGIEGEEVWLLIAYLPRASSSSITRTKFSSGWAPTSMRPLIKNAGLFLAGLGFGSFFFKLLGQIFQLIAADAFFKIANGLA